MCDKTIRTFVVFDLETNNFPNHQFNKCSITEMSLYAFSSDNVRNDCIDNKNVLTDLSEEGVKGFDKNPPELPRCLHKLTLMINPLRAIHPDAERISGLSNDMLEYESPFDTNTAECLNLFLARLEGPVCLVAHNGMSFDFPILRYVYDRIEVSFPSSVYCVDSLHAFREIDEKLNHIGEQHVANIENENNEMPTSSRVIDPLVDNAHIDWQHRNETTPHRKTKAEKRRHSACNGSNSPSDSLSPEDRQSNNLNARRALFADNSEPKPKYNKKGEYKLGNIYKRCFNKEPLNLHRAESDVEVLTKLILYYGLYFLAYAEERKELFSSVPKLGTRTN